VTLRPSRTGATGLLAAAFLALTAVAAAPASAHSDLVSSSPEDGATLTRAPSSVVLTFNEDVQVTGTAVVVTGPDGVRVDRGADLVVDATTVTVPLDETTTPGTFTAAYRVVSADGHVITGSLTYQLVLPGSGSVAPSPSDPTSPEPAAPTSASDTGGSSVAPWGVLVGIVAVAAVALALVLRWARRSGG
jgi:methionine-rich copper-binding protein CopC